MTAEGLSSQVIHVDVLLFRGAHSLNSRRRSVWDDVHDPLLCCASRELVDVPHTLFRLSVCTEVLGPQPCLRVGGLTRSNRTLLSRLVNPSREFRERGQKAGTNLARHVLACTSESRFCMTVILALVRTARYLSVSRTTVILICTTRNGNRSNVWMSTHQLAGGLLV